MTLHPGGRISGEVNFAADHDSVVGTWSVQGQTVRVYLGQSHERSRDTLSATYSDGRLTLSHSDHLGDNVYVFSQVKQK